MSMYYIRLWYTLKFAQLRTVTRRNCKAWYSSTRLRIVPRAVCICTLLLFQPFYRMRPESICSAIAYARDKSVREIMPCIVYVLTNSATVHEARAHSTRDSIPLIIKQSLDSLETILHLVPYSMQSPASYSHPLRRLLYLLRQLVESALGLLLENARLLLNTN